jgi:heme/copper-type cytochrome/quinol oxidase subunit 2
MNHWPRVLFLIALIAMLPPAIFAQTLDEEKPPEAPPQVIMMTAKSFEFSPTVIHIKAGKKVQLKVTSKDITHAIRVNPFADNRPAGTSPGLSFTYGEDCWKLRPGETVTIELIAYNPGTYTYSCCKKCGPDGSKMEGHLIVDP